MLIETDHPVISISRQCDLLGLSRSSYYYEGSSDEDSFNLDIMRLMDEQYTRTPFYGVPRMTAFLRRKDYEVNPKRIRRLMRLMGIEAIYPRRKLSKPCPEHTVYPYLLKGLDIDRPDLVWCSDITYIRLFHGFVYLVAIMDWFSRYVLAWALSTTLDASFCVHALKMALALGKPAIFNTDQGSQFTSADFTTPLKEAGIRISMDGRGRVFDNIFIERLWRSVKYEEVYVHDYRSVSEARYRLSEYFHLYNQERLHQALGYRTPYEVYYAKERGINVIPNANRNAPY